MNSAWWRIAHSIIYKSMKIFMKLSRKSTFHQYNSKTLSNGRFNEGIRHENDFTDIMKRCRWGINVNLCITILILTYSIWIKCVAITILSEYLSLNR